MPKETYNQLLKELLEELEKRKQDSSEPDQIRIMISGSIMNNHQFVRDLEELGISVVAEEHCGGVRYFEDLVDINTYPDPWEAVSRRYLSNFPCARMVPCEERVDRTVKLAKDLRVEGVIAMMTRYCTNLDYDQPWLKDGLKSQGIPMLELSVEYGMPMTGQIRTRLEAFKEMLLDWKGELI
jgi:benzoyl-CoA reductase/2-hydroxyglutaryl-CoA dehydratase subunit BcrC/BadD/HgdB